MQAKSLLSNVLRNIRNIPGWQTKRKIVVVESDDWGSIRMRSSEAYLSFLDKGYNVDKSNYNSIGRRDYILYYRYVKLFN